MRRLILFPCLLTAACATVTDTIGPDGTAPATLSWYLPRTEAVRIEGYAELRECSEAGDGRADLKIALTASAAPVTVADWTTRRTIPAASLSGWRTANEVSLESWPEGMVRSIGAKSKDETATIAGNVLKTAVKVASLAAGVIKPASPPLDLRPVSRRACGEEAGQLLVALKAAEKELLDKAPEDKQLAALTARVSRLREALRLPLVRPLPLKADFAQTEAAIKIAGPIGPTDRDLVRAGWLADGATAVALPAIRPELTSLTDPALLQPDGPLPAEAHYREPARLVLTLHAVCARGNDCGAAGQVAATPFGVAQWGIPRRLKLKAGLFETLEQSYAFDRDGTPTSSKVVTTARGVAASGLLLEAATSAGTAYSSVAAAAAKDAETAKLQAQTARIKAQLDLLKAQAELRAYTGAQ